MRTVIHPVGDLELSREQLEVTFPYRDELLKITCRILQAGISERIEAEEYNHPNPPFCRLFLFEANGAEITTAQGKEALEPGVIYLLPPDLPFFVRYHDNSNLVFFHLHIFDYSGTALFSGTPGIERIENLELFRTTYEAGYGNDMLALSVELFRAVRLLITPRLQEVYEQHLRLKSFAELIDYVSSHPGSLIGISELAELYGVTANTLSKRFKRATGISLKEYLLSGKLKQVQDLLLHTPLTIVEISQLTGFSSSQYLQSFFRSATGTTPAIFRKLHRLDGAG